LSSELEWHEDASCGKKENQDKIDWFFSNNKTEIASAKIICMDCPVRLQCAKWALEDKQREGVWGGMDQKRIKRTLSINWDGQEMRRNRFPKCPGCDARTLELITKTVDRPNGGRWATMRMVECTECGFVPLVKIKKNKTKIVNFNLIEITVDGEEFKIQKTKYGTVPQPELDKLAARCHTLDELQKLGKQLGYKSGWAYEVLKRRNGGQSYVQRKKYSKNSSKRF